MSNAQLKLVPTRESSPQPRTADPIRSVFEHWLAVHDKNPARCKLGPTRRQAIAAALLLYTADDLHLAIEGNLIDPWCVANSRHDVDWILVGESRIERFIELGDKLRAQVGADEQQQAQAQQAPAASDPAVAAAYIRRLRAVADAARRSGVLHG